MEIKSGVNKTIIRKTFVLFLVLLLSMPANVFAANFSSDATSTKKISFTNTNGNITIKFPALNNLSSKKYSTDGGNTWLNYTAAFKVASYVRIVAQYTYNNDTYFSNPYIVNGGVSNNTSNDGDWSVKSGVSKLNTPEAQLMYRIGDIDNFGYGFDAGFDPFTGNATKVHAFPWSTPSDEPQGLDRIMEVSGYKTSSTHDGYTDSYNNDPSNHKVAPVVLSYNLTGISVQNATIMMFVDDIQPGSAKGISGGNVTYTATINGVQFDGFSSIINNLDESGPIGRLISFRIPNTSLDIVRTGSLSILLDDKVSGCTGDGYAIDFVKLLVNSTSISNTCTINGTVTDKSTGAKLSGANISVGGLTTATDTNGSYSLSGIPAGQAVISVSKTGYLPATSTNNVIAYNIYTQNFQLESTPKPGTPSVGQDPNVATSQPVKVTITYPDNPATKKYSIAQDSNGNDIWLNYTSTFSVSSNLTVKAYGISSAGISSDTATYAITNIDTSVPSSPTLTEDNIKLTNQDVHVTASNFDAKAFLNEISIDGGANWTVYSQPVTISQNTTVMARTKNALGTCSPYTTLNITNINKATPDAPTLAEDNTNLTNKDVTVTVTYPIGALAQSVSTDSGATWIGYSAPITIHGNTTVEAKYTNVYGSISSIGTLIITNIDKSIPAKPTISEDNTNFTSGNVNITVDYPSGALNKKVSIDDGGSWTTYAGPVVMSSNNIVLATYENVYGTTSEQGVLNVTNIDKTVPTAPTLSSNNTKPTQNPVIVTAVYSTDSQIQLISIDDGANWIPYTQPVTISQNTTIRAKGINAAGTPSTVTTLNITNIDTTPPTADVHYETNSDGSITASLVNPSENFIVNNNSGSLSYTFTVNGTFTFKLQDDAGNDGTVDAKANSIAPKADVTYETNTDGSITASLTHQTENITVTNNNSSSSYIFVKNGNFTFEFKDDYGNVGRANAIVNTIKPSSPILAEVATSNPNKTVTMTATFPADEVNQSIFNNEVQITTGLSKIINTDSIVVTFNVPSPANCVITAIGTDNYNCSSDKASLTITPPTAEIDYVINANSITANLVRQSSNITVTSAGGNSHTFTAPGSFQFMFVDDYGNEGSVTATPTDSLPTMPTFSQDVTTPTTGTVHVTVIPSQAGLVIQYSEDGQTWLNYTTPIAVSVNDTTIYARCLSVLGTPGQVASYQVTNIETAGTNGARLNR